MKAELVRRKELEGRIIVPQFSPDMKFVFIGTDKGKGYLLSLENEDRDDQYEADGPIGKAAFSPDGRYVLFATEKKAYLRSLQNKGKGWELELEPVGRRVRMRIVFSPDGKFVLIVKEGIVKEIIEGGKAVAYLISVEKGEVLKRELLKSESEVDKKVESVSLSPDGKHIFVKIAHGGIRKEVYRVCCETGQVEHFELNEVESVKPDKKCILEEDEKHILVRSQEVVVCLMSAERGEIKWQQPVDGFITDLAFSPDGKWALIGVSRGKVGLLSVEKGEVEWKQLGDCPKIVFLPGGRYVLGRFDEKICLISWPSWVVEWEKEISLSDVIAFPPDGRFILRGTSGMVYQIPLEKERRGWKQEVHGKVECIKFLPDGRILVGTSGSENFREGILYLMSREDGKVERKWKVEGRIREIITLPDGKSILVAYERDSYGVLCLVSHESEEKDMKTEWEIKVDRQIYSIALSPDGKYALIGSWWGLVYLLSLENKVVESWCKVGEENIRHIMLSPDGKSAFVVTGRTVYQISCESREVKWKRPIDRFGEVIKITPARDSIFVHTVWSIYRISRKTGEVEWEDGVLGPVALSPDGKWILMCDTQTVMRLLSRENRKTVWEKEAGWITNAEFSPDGKYVFVEASGRMIYLTSRENGEEVIRKERVFCSPDFIRSPDGSFRKIIFSPDGRFALAITHSCKRVHLIPCGAGERKTKQMRGEIRHAAFSPDAKSAFVVIGVGDEKGNETAECWKLIW